MMNSMLKAQQEPHHKQIPDVGNKTFNFRQEFKNTQKGLFKVLSEN